MEKTIGSSDLRRNIPTIISSELTGQGATVTPPTGRDKATDLRRSREAGGPILAEQIQSDYRDKKMGDRLINSTNRRDDWHRNDGARVGAHETPKDRADALQKWNEWLQENESAFFNHYLKANCDSSRIIDQPAIKLVEELARQEIKNTQQSLHVNATKDEWEQKVREAVLKVVGTPDIKQLIQRFKEERFKGAGDAGDRHLHYGKEKGRPEEHLFIRDPSTARKEDIKPHPLAFFFRTAWKAFQNSKVTAVEQVRDSIDRIYGPGMGERVLDAMRQQHGWKPRHGVKESELAMMDEIAQALSKFDQSKKDHKQWIAQACTACGVDVASLHEGGQWGVLQAEINRVLNRLPPPDADANADDVQRAVKRAVQVAVLHTIALPKRIRIDGYSLFLQNGAFRNVEIGDAYRALVAISGRECAKATSPRKVKVEAFARAVWMEEVCRSCGIDRTDLDWDQVRDAIDEAVRSLPDDPERKQRAAYGAILRVACKLISPKLRINDDREGYKALMRSLFRDDGGPGSHYRDDIGSVYASFKLLAGQRVNEETYSKAWDVQHWMDSNYERVRTKIVLQGGISPVTPAGEKEMRQSVGRLVAANVDLTPLADGLIAQRKALLGNQREEESDEDFSKRIRQADALRDKARSHLARQFERAAEIALLQQAFPHFAESSEVWASLTLRDGKHRELPLVVIRGALGAVSELKAASFADAALDFEGDQDAWQNKWLDDNLKATINTVTSQYGINAENLLGGRAAVKEALGLLALPLARDPMPVDLKDQIQRVAEGALIAEDLLARVRRSRQQNDPPSEGYSRQEQLQFEEVMQSLFLPGGTNDGCNLALAHKVLRPKADQGAQVTLATFEWAGQEHEVTLKPLAEIGDARGDDRSDDESQEQIEFSDDHPNDEGVPVDHDSSLTVVSPFANGRQAWIDDNMSAVLAEARQACGDPAAFQSGMPRGVVYTTISGLLDTTTQKQAIRAAEGALIEQHLLHEMGVAEKAAGRGKEDLKKRELLKAVIASVFHPNGSDNDLSVSAAYKALFYFVSRVDMSLEDSDFKSMALELDRPVASASISKSSTNAASAHLKATLQRVSRQTGLRANSVNTDKALELIALAKKSLLPANAEDADLRRAAEVGIIASAFSGPVDWNTEDAAKLLAELVKSKGEFRNDSLATIGRTLAWMLAEGKPMNLDDFRAAKTSVGIRLGEERRVWLNVWLSQHPEMSQLAVQRVNALPLGVPDAAMERVARGAQMESRLKEHHPTEYALLSEKYKKNFDNLMLSLFDLDGDRYEDDIHTAIVALESFVGMHVGGWDLDKALGDVPRQRWAKRYLGEAIATVDRQCAPPRPLPPDGAQKAINLGLSWLREAGAPADEMERAVQIGLIEQAIGFPSNKSKAHVDVMRSLVNRDEDNKFFNLELATVDEALRLLHLSKTEVKKTSFDRAVEKILMRDRIVKDTAKRCGIKLDGRDMKQLNRDLVPAMTRPGDLQKGLERCIRGMVIGYDVVARMEDAGLPAGNDFNDLMNSLFDPDGTLRNEVDFVEAHGILRKFVVEREKFTVTNFSSELAARKASKLKPAQRVAAARLWMEYEVKTLRGEIEGAAPQRRPLIGANRVVKPTAEEDTNGTVALEEAVNSFLSGSEEMGILERIGRAAFHDACADHFMQPIGEALSLVAQPPLTPETFHAALEKLLKLDEPFPQGFANLLRAARGEIDRAPPFDPDLLRTRFDWELLHQGVIYLSEAHVKRRALTQEQAEAIDRFLDILQLAAGLPDDEETEHPDIALITEARATYKAFVETVVARGVPYSTPSEQGLNVNSQGKINKAEGLAAPAMGGRTSTNYWTDAILKVHHKCGIGTNPDSKTLITQVVDSLRGATEDELKRAAEGALIKHDLLVRVKRARTRSNEPKYSDEEQEEFDSVMASLFAPGGEHCNIDIKTAHAVLCFFADDGLPVSRDQFIEAMAADDGDTFLSLAAFRKATAGLRNAPGHTEVRYSHTGHLHIKAGIGQFLTKKLGTSSAADHEQTRIEIVRLLNIHDEALGQPVIGQKVINAMRRKGWTDASPVTVADIATIEEEAIALKRKTARLPKGFWEETFKEFCEQYGEVSLDTFNEEHREQLARGLKDFATDATAKEIKRFALEYLFQIADFPNRPKEEVAFSRYAAVMSSLFHKDGKQYGKHYDVDIGAARRALQLLRTRKLEVNPALFDHALWIPKNVDKAISNTVAACGINPGKVVDFVGGAKRNMWKFMKMKEGAEGQSERIVAIAVVATVFPLTMKITTTDERKRKLKADYANVAASLFTEKGAHRDLDIELAYAVYKWLADHRLDVDIKTFAAARPIVKRQSWLDRNYEKTLTRVRQRCEIKREDFSQEMFSQVSGVVSSMDGATDRALERKTQEMLIGAALRKNYPPRNVGEVNAYDKLMRSLSEAKGTRIQVDFGLAYAALVYAYKNGNVDETSFDHAKVQLEKERAGQRRIWAQEYCEAVIKKGWLDLKRFPRSPALITAEVIALPFGVTDHELERAAHGVVIEHKLLERVKETRQKWAEPVDGYKGGELKNFKDVMRSVFHPDGEHHGMDMDTASETLRSFADLGERVDPNTFIERKQVVEVDALPLKDKAALVQQWIRQEIKVPDPDDQAEASPPTYLAYSDVDGFLRGNQSAAKKEDSRSIKARAALRSVGEPFFENRVNSAVEVLQQSPEPFDFEAIDEVTVASTRETFHEAMQRLLGGGIETIQKVVHDLPADLCDLVSTGSTAVDEARFDPVLMPQARQEQLKKLHERFNTVLALRILNPMLVDARSKNRGELDSQGLPSFTALLEKVANERTPEESQYHPDIRDALAAWRANYSAFVTSMIERGQPIET